MAKNANAPKQSNQSLLSGGEVRGTATSPALGYGIGWFGDGAADTVAPVNQQTETVSE